MTQVHDVARIRRAWSERWGVDWTDDREVRRISTFPTASEAKAFAREKGWTE